MLSIVIPAHNEAGNILLLLQESQAVLARISTGNSEIIVVDDASSDGMADLIRLHYPPDSEIRVLRHSCQAGQSAAVRTGISAARGDIIVTIDGDGQNDPADIPAMLDVYRLERDLRREVIICGYRINRRDNGLRRFSSRIANSIRRALLADATPDSGCGLKVFSRDLYLRLPYFDHMHRYLPALAIREGAVPISHPINHRPRQAGRAHYGVWNRLWVGILDLFGVWWLLRRRRNPGSIQT